MNTLSRWDPWREMSSLRTMMDRMFDEQALDAPRWARGEDGFPLALDVAEDDEHYIVKASIPGIDPDDVEITLADNVLTIKGHTAHENDINEKNYHLRERRYGTFMRSVTLPAPLNSDKVDASHERGVLTLRLPKAESVKPKRIAINATVNGS